MPVEIGKTCIKCGEVKAVELFPNGKNICKLCTKKRLKEWCLANPEKSASYRKKWLLANQAKDLKARKKYRLANPEKRSAIVKNYLLRNRENQAKYRENKRLNDPHYFARLSLKNRQTFPERTAAERHRRVQELRSSYVAGLIAQMVGFTSDVNYENFIEIKRTHIKILRKIKELANER